MKCDQDAGLAPWQRELRWLGYAEQDGQDLIHGFFALLLKRHALHHVLQTLPIPKRPDGMKVSPEGRYAVVAVEKGGERSDPIRVHSRPFAVKTRITDATRFGPLMAQ